MRYRHESIKKWGAAADWAAHFLSRSGAGRRSVLRLSRRRLPLSPMPDQPDASSSLPAQGSPPSGQPDGLAALLDPKRGYTRRVAPEDSSRLRLDGHASEPARCSWPILRTLSASSKTSTSFRTRGAAVVKPRRRSQVLPIRKSGTWRSQAARIAGGDEVPGSNPGVPTTARST